MRKLNGTAYAMLLSCALLLAAVAHATPAPQLAPVPASYAGTYRYKTYRSGQTGTARKGASVDAPGLRQVKYDQLAEFVNDYEAHKTGAHFLITSVPAEKVKLVKPLGAGASRRGMFYLQTDEDDSDAATSFVTSAALVKNLRASAVAETTTLRVTAVLVEFAGEFDVYRSSFVTKIEGYGEDGLLLWVATGAEPVKVKMRQ